MRVVLPLSLSAVLLATSLPAAAADGAGQPLGELLTALIVEIIPREYEDRKHWGMQTKVFDGLKFSGQGLDIKVRKRERKVNHGAWKIYQIKLVDPERTLQVRLSDFHKAESGRAAFDAVISAKLHAFGRVSQWERGLQLASFSSEALAKVELRVNCELGLRVDATKVPLEFVLEPQVTGADLDLADFRMLRVSKLDGPLVHELGRSLRKKVAEELDAKSDKLAARLNKSITKHQDKLRLSATGFLASQWEGWREYLSPRGDDKVTK